MLRKPAGRLGVVSPCERSENRGGVGERGWAILARCLEVRIPSGPLLGRAWYRVFVSCWLLVKKVFSHRVLVQPSLDALYRGATEDVCSVRVCVSKSSVLLNAFFACFFWMPCTGDLCIYFAGFFRPSLKWFWKNRGMAPCFFAGCWWKSRSLKNIARCGHMCQSKLGCFALSRQPGLVVCEVPKLAVCKLS